MQPWNTLSRQTILQHSKHLSVEDHTVELPDGRVIPHWAWTITLNYVNVVAVTQAGLFLCFRQTKYGLSGDSLAAVGGYLEPGEEPLAAAQRELREETGYLAEEWIPLGDYREDANHGGAIAHLYLARGAIQVAQPNSDDLEEQELLLLSQDGVRRALAAGEFKVLAWAAAMGLALNAASI